MTSFAYRALGANGEPLNGVQDAGSAADLAAQLQGRGALVLSVRPARRGIGVDFRGFSGGLRGLELAEVTRELSSLLGAGQDLDRALRLMVEEASPRVAAVLGRVRDAVRDGASLANALQREPGSFSRLYLGLVRAGEAGGQLAATLERLALLLERQRALQASIQAALVYPAILCVAAVGSIFMLLTQVLPQLAPLFSQNGVALPPLTAFLLGLGQGMARVGPLVLVGGAVAIVLLMRALQRPGPRLLADRLLLRLPVVGDLLRDILGERFARTLGSLVGNGVALLPALTIVLEVLGNRVAEAAVLEAAEAAKAGQSMARSLQRAGIFPRRLAHMLRLGEETAQIGPLALRAADLLEERTRLNLTKLTTLLVPVITILMGVAVAVIVSSLLLAMLSLNDIANQ